MANARVDFPLPFGPMSAWTRPRSTVRSIPLRISFSWTLTRRSLTTKPCSNALPSLRPPLCYLWGGRKSRKRWTIFSFRGKVAGRMQSDRFFESTRGKILAALRGSRGTAFELAERFGVSANAVRQQLLILERDGLVDGHSVRRGKT